MRSIVLNVVVATVFSLGEIADFCPAYKLFKDSKEQKYDRIIERIEGSNGFAKNYLKGPNVIDVIPLEVFIWYMDQVSEPESG